MKSYVTGMHGFIGSHLVKQLESPVAIPHQFIRTVELTPFDYFYFLSSYGNMIEQTDDKKIWDANFGDVLHILQSAKTQKIKLFVYFSSSSVKLRTKTMYARSKRAAEEALLSYMERYDFPVCIIQPFTVIGVGEQKTHLIPTLIDAAFTGRAVNLAPTPVHDFIDVEDLVEGVMTLVEYKARGIFELGTGKMHSNLEILQLVEAISGKRINVTYVDSMRSYDTNQWVSTKNKVRGYGWIPRTKLSETIEKMIEAYRKENNVTE